MLVILAVAAPTNCTGPIGAAGCLIGGAQNAIGGAIDTVNFWTDPWGNTFKALQDSARSLAQTVLPTITHATLPDLNADWFIKAYAVTFALAILVAVVLLFPQVLRTARGQQSGRDLLDSMGMYFPLFLISSMFGPPFGALLVNFFGAISDSIVSWGIVGTADSITAKFQTMLSEGDAGGIAGGAPVGVLLMLFMLIGLLLVVIMLIVQLVTLYFTGVLLPLGLVWIIDPTKRQFGMKILGIWLGLLASHPLLFLLLSFAYLMVGNSVDVFGANNTLQKTVTLIVSLLALFMAGLSPLALMKLAPVLPMGNGGSNGPSFGPEIGARNMTDADNKYGSPVKDPGSGPSTAGGGSGAHAAPVGAEEEATAGAGSLSEAAASNTGAGAGAAATAATTAEGATAAEGLAAAGAAESSTGIGAVIGVPSMIAAGAIAAGGAAKDATDKIADQAAAPVENHEEHYGRDSTQ
jgi:hypothetical protein